MHTKRMLLVIAAAAAAAGCGGSGGSLCDNVISATAKLVPKAQPCTTTPIPAPTTTVAQCNAQVAQCTDADKQVIQRWVDCLNALPTCAPATQAAFSTSFSACQAPLSALTPACAASVGS